jgi:ATP-dependent helicase/nuclease subunit A
VRGAKEVALGAAELLRTPTGEGDHGTSWGTVIHVLLETAMREPAADLADLARSALEEQELPAALAPQALATVAAVRASALWGRAVASGGPLVEVPFVACLAPGDPALPEPSAVPVLVHGVVDLAFPGPDGWVLADWKTDAGAAARRDALVERYRGQLALYAEAWRRIAGEPVAEQGIFFVATREYVTL